MAARYHARYASIALLGDISAERLERVRIARRPLGMPFYYRVILSVVSLSAMAYVTYKGYEAYGPGWLLVGMPVAFVAGLFIQGAVIRNFPPKLQAHAEGSTWLKLS